MRVRAFDCESFLIGPDAVYPKQVCVTVSERIDGQIVDHLYGNGDPELLEILVDLFQVDGNILVGHSSVYDLMVSILSHEGLEHLVWAKLEAGEITDTLLRERLLNLSRHGKLDQIRLPDGSSKRLNYHLSDLIMKYAGLDISAGKTGDDIWRLRYSELDGLKGSQYPADAADYAKGDSRYTLLVYEGQEQELEDGTSSVETQFFQTASDFALGCITNEGMPIDPERFREVSDMLAQELCDDNMEPLVAAGIMTPAEPSRVHARQLKKASALYAEWTGDTAPSSEALLDWREEMEGAGIKFTVPEPTHIKTKALQHRVLCALVGRETGNDPSELYKMPFDELLEYAVIRNVRFVPTPKGDISTSSEVIDDTAPHDEILEIFKHRQKLQKMVTTELPRMTWEGEPAERVHFRFKCLVETGRTSSSSDKLYPSANGQNVDPRARPIFIPPEGYVICSVDYATLELCSVAQTMLNKFGYSVHADKINAGYDLHSYLGTQLAIKFLPEFRESVEGLSPDDAYEYFMTLKKDNNEVWKRWRKFAKPVGLGFPGGLGPYTMLTLAKKTYDVDIIAEAVERFETHPEEFDRENGSVLYYAKKLYDMDKEDVTWTPILKGIALARTLKDIWLDTYPEMIEFFASLNEQRRTKKHAAEGEDKASDDFEYESPFGMIRRGCTYTSAANGESMQTPSAEGFKSAVFNVVRATRDETLESILFGPAKVCDEIHDEILLFLRADIAHELALEVKDVMEESMKLVITDVAVKAEPCLMTRWRKEAEPEFDDEGRLIPWEPEQEESGAE